MQKTKTKVPRTIAELDQEFSEVAAKFQPIHAKKQEMVDYYNESAFYPRSKRTPADRRNLRWNMLELFADKNVSYVGRTPTLRVPPRNGGAEEQDRQHAEMLERVLRATHSANELDVLIEEWADDGTTMADAFALVNFDLQSRQVVIDKLDPRGCYYTYGNRTNRSLETFWYAEVLTKKEIEDLYNVVPTNSGINLAAVDPGEIDESIADGVERFWCVWRWDRENYCCWVGDQWLVPQGPHEYGDIPIERYVPFRSKKRDPAEPKYFLDSLLNIQAEFNHVLQGKSLYVDRSGKPLLWGRGIYGADWESVKEQTANGEGGGAVGLMQGGELGLLQPGDLKLQSDYLNQLFEFAKNTTGFSNVTFGEMVGANTSGDALDMYFQPTAQATLRQWVHFASFIRRINQRVLRYYDQFGLSDENFTVYGYEFPAQAIEGYYANEVIPPSGTPRNELEVKRTAMEAARDGFLPLAQALEDAGYPDPEAIIAQIKAQKVDPALNPDIMAQVQSFLSAQGGQPPAGGPPAPGQPPMPGGPGAPPPA